MERILFRKVELWAVGLIVVALLLGSVAFGWLVFHRSGGGDRFPRLGDAAVAVARFPSFVEGLVSGEVQLDNHVVKTRYDEPAGFTFFREVESPHYVLVSRYDGDLRWSVVELFREGETEPLHRWAFDDTEALDFDSDNPFIVFPDASDSSTLRIVHPWLGEDGRLTAHAHYGALYQVGACTDPIWTNAAFQYHHSLEPAPDGSFWTVGTEPTDIEGMGWDERLLDDHAVRVSADGEVLYAKSVLEMLQGADLLNRIYDYDRYQIDPIHLNDVEEVPEDGEVTRAGDLFLSLAHLNMVLLWRPATEEIVWWSQDRIMHQHDIDLIGPDAISVYNNLRKTGSDNDSMVLGPATIDAFELPGTQARILHDAPLAAMDVRTASQGLVDALPGAGMMVEETEGGRLVKFGADGEPDWVYVNKSQDGRTWTVNWSRYVPRAIGDPAAAALAGAAACPD